MKFHIIFCNKLRWREHLLKTRNGSTTNQSQTIVQWLEGELESLASYLALAFMQLSGNECLPRLLSIVLVKVKVMIS